MAMPAEWGSEALKEIMAVKLGEGASGREASERGNRSGSEEGDVDGKEGW